MRASTHKAVHAIVCIKFASCLCGEIAYDEPEARTYMQYARASFCSRQHVSAWNCGDACSEAAVKSGSVRFFGPSITWKMQGYVAELPVLAQEGDRHCIAAFRGSTDLMNWIADEYALGLWKTPWPNWEGADIETCPDCEVQRGIALVYQEIRPFLLDAIANLSCSRLALSGHSLAGALVSLAALDIRSHLGMHVGPVYTFGEPRFANYAYTKAFIEAAHRHNDSPPLWRVVLYHDLIPRLGFASMGYVHEPCEVYYVDGLSSAYRVCESTMAQPENLSCSWAASAFECMGGSASALHNSYMNLATLEDKLDPNLCASPTGGMHEFELLHLLVLLVVFLSCAGCAFRCCCADRRHVQAREFPYILLECERDYPG